MISLRCARWLWLNAALCSAFEPPPLSVDMAHVLRDGGLTLREEFVAYAPRRHAAPPADTLVLLAGLARTCYPAIVRAALDECGRRNATLVALLQHYAPGEFPADISWLKAMPRAESLPVSFEACAALFARESANEIHGGCALIVGRQHFTYAPSQHRCRSPLGMGILHNQPRAMIQTIAVGRAYEWGLAAEPRARLFVRVRLDTAFAIPQLHPKRDMQHELLTNDFQEDLVLGGVYIHHGSKFCY